MLRSEAKQLILGWLDQDSNGTYFTDTLLNLWINRAQKHVQLQLLQAGHNWYMKPVQTTLVIGQTDYVLPSDCIEIHRVEIILSGTGTNEDRQQLVEMTTNEQDRISTQSGQPTNYYIKKDRITLSPTPDQALVLRIYYSPIVADTGSDSDALDIPDQYSEYTCIVAAYNGFIKDDRVPNNLVMKKTETEALLKQMAVDRVTEKSRQIVQTIDYDNSAQW